MKKTFLLLTFLLIFLCMKSQEYKTQVESNNEFTFELFSVIDSAGENVFLSPFSVSSALAMTYEGARGKTRKEMAKVLHFPEKSETINNSFHELINEVQKSKNPKFYTLSLANSIWAQEGYKFLHSFFSATEKYYGAKLKEVDFEDNKNREKAREEINLYVAEKTNQKIKELLDKSTLGKDTKMVLVNVVYFLAQWDTVFNKKMTAENDFFGINGTEKKEFMHRTGTMKYAEKNNIRMLEIPYKDKKASMVILLPDTSVNFSEFKKSLTYHSFLKLYKDEKYENIELSFPKFKSEYKNDLAKTLYAAGMKAAFSNHADFSGMTCKKELQIDKVIHQTYINTDESGTEAAAATAVVMRKMTSGNPGEKIVFNANRPFVYLIRENTTGSILFIGQLIK